MSTTTPKSTSNGSGCGCGSVILSGCFLVAAIAFWSVPYVGPILTLIFLFLAAVPWITAAANRKADKLEAQRTTELHASLVDQHLLPPVSPMNVEVVGENYRRDAFQRLYTGTGTPDGAQMLGTARLIPEPTNKKDPNAVAVWYAGEHVGYLPKEIAGDYAKHFSSMIAEGRAPVVPARVWARNDAGTWRARVTLSLAEPLFAVPANEPPASAVMLPAVRTYQVAGEKLHMEAVRPWLGRGVYATLAPCVEKRPRSSRTLLEVRINGRRVGTLTPATSSDLLPLVERLAAQGRATAVTARVEGNTLSAEVTIRADRVANLDEAWIHRHVPGGT